MQRSVVFLGLLAAGCPTPEPVETVYHPSVSFLSPSADTTVPAGDIAVSIVVADFVLAQPATLSHWRPVSPLWLFVPEAEAHNGDGAPRGYAVLRVDGSYQADLRSVQYTLTGVAAGPHTLDVELLFEDGDAFDPPVTASVGFVAE